MQFLHLQWIYCTASAAYGQLNSGTTALYDNNNTKKKKKKQKSYHFFLFHEISPGFVFWPLRSAIFLSKYSLTSFFVIFGVPLWIKCISTCRYALKRFPIRKIANWPFVFSRHPRPIDIKLNTVIYNTKNINICPCLPRERSLTDNNRNVQFIQLYVFFQITARFAWIQMIKIMIFFDSWMKSDEWWMCQRLKGQNHIKAMKTSCGTTQEPTHTHSWFKN